MNIKIWHRSQFTKYCICHYSLHFSSISLLCEISIPSITNSLYVMVLKRRKVDPIDNVQATAVSVGNIIGILYSYIIHYSRWITNRVIKHLGMIMFTLWPTYQTLFITTIILLHLYTSDYCMNLCPLCPQNWFWNLFTSNINP